MSKNAKRTLAILAIMPIVLLFAGLVLSIPAVWIWIIVSGWPQTWPLLIPVFVAVVIPSAAWGFTYLGELGERPG